MKSLQQYLNESIFDIEADENHVDFILKDPNYFIPVDNYKVAAMAEAIKIKFGKDLKDDVKQMDAENKKNHEKVPTFYAAVNQVMMNLTAGYSSGEHRCSLNQYSVENIDGNNHLVWTGTNKYKWYFDAKNMSWRRI